MKFFTTKYFKGYKTLLLLLVFLSGQLSAFLYCSIISVLEIKRIQFIQYIYNFTYHQLIFWEKMCDSIAYKKIHILAYEIKKK